MELIKPKKKYNENQMRIALLSLNWYRRKDPRTPLGIAYIYSVLMNLKSRYTDLDVNLLQFDTKGNLSDVLHEIMVLVPDILGISVYAWNAYQVKMIIDALRSFEYNGSIVLGGSEITYGGDELNDEFSGADYFVKGFGEQAFSDLIEGMISGNDLSIKGVYKNGDKIGNLLAVAPTGIPNSPFSHDEIIPMISGDKFIRWQTQRGCVFRCSFCAFTIPSGNVEESDIETVRYELEKIKEIGTSSVAVLDPVFFLNKKRAIEILDLISYKLPGIKFSIQTRYEHLDTEIIAKLSSMNVKLECGLQTLDNKVQLRIKRINNREKVIDMMKELTDQKIEYETHLIYGLPEQTNQSFLSDIYTVAESGNSRLRVFPLSKLRGTELANTTKDGEIYFSPFFPNEVIQTRWMTGIQILNLKKFQRRLEDAGGQFDLGLLDSLLQKEEVVK
jgi:radical SAM superfamily enzyme YgiQ (UPF0313 family)